MICSPYFLHAPFVLLFTKTDLLKERIASENPFDELQNVLPKFKRGPAGSDDYPKVVDMIKQLYLDRIPSGHEVHVHFVNALDSNEMGPFLRELSRIALENKIRVDKIL